MACLVLTNKLFMWTQSISWLIKTRQTCMMSSIAYYYFSFCYESSNTSYYSYTYIHIYLSHMRIHFSICFIFLLVISESSVDYYVISIPSCVNIVMLKDYHGRMRILMKVHMSVLTSCCMIVVSMNLQASDSFMSRKKTAGTNYMVQKYCFHFFG